MVAQVGVLGRKSEPLCGGGVDLSGRSQHNPGMTSPRAEPPSRLPVRLLQVYLALQLLLSLRQLWWRQGFPPRTNHFGFKNILELRRMLTGYTPAWPLVHPGRTTHFLPESTPIEWWNPLVVFAELTSGNLRPLWQNHADVIYWIELPHPFFLATLFGALTDWQLWLIPLVFTGYLLLLLVSVYGIGAEVDGPWTGLVAAVIAGGYPVLFGLGRVIHDTLPIAAWASFMVWMLLRSHGFSRWRPCLGFGIAGWTALRSGESFYGCILLVLVLLAPVVLSLIERTRAGWSRGSLGGVSLAVGLPVVSFDWWWFPGALKYLFEEDPMADVAMAPRVAKWVDQGVAQVLEHSAYFVTLANDLVRPPSMALLLLGLLFLWRSPARKKWMILLMSAIPLMALSWMTRKSNWYIVPAIPPMALLTAMGLRGLPGARLRGAALGLAAATGLTVLIGYSTISDDTRRAIPQWVERPFRRLVTMREVELAPFQAYPGRAVVGAAAEIDDALARVAPKGDEEYMLALFCQDQFWAWTLKYFIEMQRPDVHVVSLIHMNLLEHYAGMLNGSEFDLLVHLGEHGLEVWKPDNQGLPSGLNRPPPQGNVDHFGRILRGINRQQPKPERTHRAAIYRLGE